MAVGIALAAFVMAMLFSPSLTALIGRRAWRPEPLIVSIDVSDIAFT